MKQVSIQIALFLSIIIVLASAVSTGLYAESYTPAIGDSVAI